VVGEFPKRPEFLSCVSLILFPMSRFDAIWKLLRNAGGAFLDLMAFFWLTLRTPQAVAAENLFLRKQLALYVEREARPRPPTDAIRFTLAQLSRLRSVARIIRAP